MKGKLLSFPFISFSESRLFNELYGKKIKKSAAVLTRVPGCGRGPLKQHASSVRCPAIAGPVEFSNNTICSMSFRLWQEIASWQEIVAESLAEDRRILCLPLAGRSGRGTGQPPWKNRRRADPCQPPLPKPAKHLSSPPETSIPTSPLARIARLPSPRFKRASLQPTGAPRSPLRRTMAFIALRIAWRVSISTLSKNSASLRSARAASFGRIARP